ncbi:MAG: Gfo/Idh/MocA family oxidoreductase [Bacteroidota bacterium]|jgi:UDP-N-acetyl-2-amino-2-deoxyglucuronate dehydrogenase
MNPINFALIGAAGYIAPRHMKAIKDTNNVLVAALDKNDSVGVIDSYFPNADFFLESERFDRHLYKLHRESEDKHVKYVGICSPNYLHDAHIRVALRNQANAICEKPLVLNPWNIEFLADVEKETGKKIYNILQLRLHPSIIQLKKEIEQAPSNIIYDIDLTYITSRGSWYFISWKGDKSKSGGIATNIGVHFYDMLTYIFGGVRENIVNYSSNDAASGMLILEKARVRWFLSINSNYLPKEVREKGQTTYRSITVNNNEIEFSGGFTDLHTQSYQQILAGNGFGLQDARNSIEIVHTIRNSSPIGLIGDYHPLLNNKF